MAIKKTITIRINEKTIEKLKDQAEKENKNFTELAREIIEDYLKKC